jgi:hypothetical protein
MCGYSATIIDTNRRNFAGQNWVLQFITWVPGMSFHVQGLFKFDQAHFRGLEVALEGATT